MKKFSSETISDIISDYLNNQTIRSICLKYDMDVSVLHRLLKFHNIQRVKNTYKTKELDILHLYSMGHSCTDIGKMLHISRNSVSDTLKNNEVEVINYKYINTQTGKRQSHKYTINENVLENIDTFEKAQFLGLMFADGCIIRNTDVFNISLKVDDIEYLKNINTFLECSKPVSLLKTASRRFFKRDNKFYNTKDAYGIRMSCRKIKEDLMKWGIIYNKSDTDFPIPPIPKNLLNAFVLGYFEGDGTIASSIIKNRKTISHNFSIICQPKFAEELQKVFMAELSIASGIYTKKSQPNLRTINISKINDLIKLYHWLYDKAPYCMMRKHDKFLHILNFFKNRGYVVGDLCNFRLIDSNINK